MKIINHRSLTALQNSAKENNCEVFETDTSFSFRIFENKQTKEFHIFSK